MKRLSIVFIVLLSSLILAGNATSHIKLDYPAGGETFVAGEKIEIQWQILIPHGEHTDWDLFFSPDGGDNWEIIQLDMPKSQFNYLWTVPHTVTEQAQIRILQDGIGYNGISGEFSIREITSSVQARDEYPKIFALYSNYPNPFNPATTIEFSLTEARFVTLVVYDITSQKVMELVSGEKISGHHSVIWNGTDEFGHNVSSGIYFYRLQTGDFTKTKAMTLVR